MQSWGNVSIRPKWSVLRAVNIDTSCKSIEQSLFKQIVIKDGVLDLVHLRSEERRVGKECEKMLKIVY